MMKTKLSSLLLVSMFLLGGPFAYAADKACMSDRSCKEDGFEKMAKELNLTDSQKTLVKAHREKCGAEMKASREEMMIKRKALKEELDKTDTDKTKVEQLKNDLKALEAGQIDNMVDRITEMKQILTPEQFEKMNKNMNKKMNDMKKKTGKGMHNKGTGMRGKGEMMGPGMDDMMGPGGMDRE